MFFLTEKCLSKIGTKHLKIWNWVCQWNSSTFIVVDVYNNRITGNLNQIFKKKYTNNKIINNNIKFSLS